MRLPARVKRLTPSSSSSAATCRPSVGWVRPSARAAAESDPVSAVTTAARARFQSKFAAFQSMRKRMVILPFSSIHNGNVHGYIGPIECESGWRSRWKAAVYKQYGGPEVVQMEEIARPVPGKGEILVRIGAAGPSRQRTGVCAPRRFRGLISTVAGRLMFGVPPAAQARAGQRFRRHHRRGWRGRDGVRRGRPGFRVPVRRGACGIRRGEGRWSGSENARNPRRCRGGGAALRCTVRAGVPRPGSRV